MSIDDIFIEADEVQSKAEQWRAHPSAPFIDWENAPTDIESSTEHRGITVYTDGSKIGGGVGAGVAIYDDGVLVRENTLTTRHTVSGGAYYGYVSTSSMQLKRKLHNL